MKVSRIFISVAILLLMAGILYADTSNKWELVSLNVNSDNRFMAGDAVGSSLVVAIGQEKDPSSGNTAMVFKRSVNGGQSFSSVSFDNYGGMLVFFTDVQMVSENFGLAIGMSIGMTGYVAGPIWKISNKAGTIEQQVAVFGEFPYCERVYCINDQKCWVSCSEGLILRTDNAGEVWTKSYLPVTDLNSPGPIHFINDQVGFVAMGATSEDSKTVMNKGQIFKTTNGGANWTAITQATTATYSAMWFTDENTGFIGKYNGFEFDLLKTTDGGANWNGVNIESKGKLSYVGAIEFLDANNGWITASFGSVDTPAQSAGYFYRTVDGGNNWTTYTPVGQDGTSAVAGQIWDMTMVNENLGYAFGEYQAVIKYGESEAPVTDGDSDPVDGDNDEDGDVETGPIYDGKPGEPCPIMNDTSTWSIPRCNIEHGSDLCLWQDDVEPFCTAFCEVDADCKQFGADACCKPVDFEGLTVTEANSSNDDDLYVKRVCFLTNNFCADYSGMWYGYNGALPGEACKAKGFEDFPPKDPNYGGFCIDEQRGGDTFVSSFCSEDSDCVGGFQTKYCCDGEYDDQNYCRYGRNCDPTWVPGTDGDDSIDGDDNTTDGDSTTITDGDTNNGSNEEDGGGCASTTGPSAIMLALTMLGVVRRRKK